MHMQFISSRHNFFTNIQLPSLFLVIITELQKFKVYLLLIIFCDFFCPKCTVSYIFKEKRIAVSNIVPILYHICSSKSTGKLTFPIISIQLDHQQYIKGTALSYRKMKQSLLLLPNIWQIQNGAWFPMINVLTVYFKENKLTENMAGHCMTWFQQFRFLNCRGLQHWYPFPREEFSLHPVVQPAGKKHHMLTFQ